MTIAVCPGSFDPVTNGHLDIIERASQIFDLVVVGVSRNSAKKPLFTIEERCELLSQVVRYLPNVKVDPIEGLLVEFAAKHQAQVIVKGLRAISDFEYEFQMALMNKRMNPEIETMFMMTRHEYSFLSSSSVKEVVSLGGNPQGLIPVEVETALNQKLRGERP
ncbi:MAG TPA: pantetheine-phosphate adenylyltransferase [Bacillota bacterium]|nr:pantetheine-phosphate adenylyltransferase [Bacillota bacterium]